MKIIDIRGKEVKKNITPYLIDWDGKSRSNYQFEVKQFLKPYWQHALVFEEFPVVGSKMTVDIFNYNARIVIEMQGEFHQKFSKFAHGTVQKWVGQIKRDAKKEEWCTLNGFYYVEIFPEDLPHLSKLFFQKKFGIIL